MVKAAYIPTFQRGLTQFGDPLETQWLRWDPNQELSLPAAGVIKINWL